LGPFNRKAASGMPVSFKRIKGKLLNYFFDKRKPSVPKLITTRSLGRNIGTHARRSTKGGEAILRPED
jgi:hypothetical protein